MRFSPEGYRQARWMFAAVILMFWFFAFILIKDSFKTRDDFQVVTGTVTEQGNTSIKHKPTSYVYYFKLSNHRQPLGIGTNKEGEPILDKSFQGVGVGDVIQVTFEENWTTKNEPVNQVVHEIVRNGEVLYDNVPTGYFWNGRMKVGLGSFIVGLVPLAILIFFERKYKKHKRLTT